MSSVPYTGSIKGNAAYGLILTGLGGLGAYIGYYDIVPPVDGRPLTNGNHIQQYSPHTSGLTIATGTAVAARGLWIIWNGAVVPSYNNIWDYGKKQYEWLTSYRCRADGMAAVTGAAAGLLGVGVSAAVANNVLSPLACGIGSAALAVASGVYLNSDKGRSSIVLLPPSAASVAPQGPVKIEVGDPLHVDTEFRISPANDPTMEFTSVGAAFVGYSCSDEYRKQNSNYFLEKSGEQLRNTFANLSQDDVKLQHQKDCPNLDQNNRELMLKLLRSKFAIGCTTIRPDQEAFRKALKQTKGNLTHPALGGMNSEAMTNVLKICYREVVAEDSGAARANTTTKPRTLSFPASSESRSIPFGARYPDRDGYYDS